MNAEYLLLLAGIALFPLLLSRDPNIGIFRHSRALGWTMLCVCLPFWAWDAAATARGHWSFNPAYVLGIEALGLPAEEWLFFVVICFVSVFTWEATKYFRREKQ